MQGVESVWVLDRGGRVEERLPALCRVLGSFGVGSRLRAPEGRLEAFVATLAHGVRRPHDRGVADELGCAHALARGFTFEQLPELVAKTHGGRSHRHIPECTPPR